MAPGTNWKKKVFPAEPVLHPEARIRKQVDAIERILNLKFRARVLDIGCGAGSQTIELARRRYRVVGMDGSRAALSEAREKARLEKLTVHFVTNDIRRIPYENEFNAVVNLRNPIGSYPRRRDDLHCLEGACQALKPGGKLLLDLLNREWLLRRLPAGSGAFDLRTGRLDCRVFSRRGGAGGGRETIRLYCLTELAELLNEAGFGLKDVWGGVDGRAYALDSQRMVVLAERLPPRKRPEKRDDGLQRAVRIKGRPR